MVPGNFSRKKRIGIAVLLALVILFSFSMRYLLQYSAATRTEIEGVLDNQDGFEVRTVSGNTQILPDKPSGTGIVFYPGGKVDETAYLPLLSQLAQNGISVVLVKMPFHLAVFRQDAATAVMESMPEIKDWYLAGHSLGGAMGCLYASKNTEKLQGLILLAAYSTADLSGSGLRVLSLYGTNDKVLDQANVLKYQSNLPATTRTEQITGGNHGYFGNYGEQAGDGTAAISREEQQRITIGFILDYLG